jgi:hypothetical protein
MESALPLWVEEELLTKAIDQREEHPEAGEGEKGPGLEKPGYVIAEQHREEDGVHRQQEERSEVVTPVKEVQNPLPPGQLT